MPLSAHRPPPPRPNPDRFSFRLLRIGLLCGSMLGMSLPVAAEPVTRRIDLLAAIAAGEMEYHINDNAEIKAPARDIFQLKDGQLHISGHGYGYVATRKPFDNYHLVLEFKWGPRTWGDRAQKARDSGILLHGHGPHGAHSESWQASVEAQIIEGGTGDILVLSPPCRRAARS